MRFQSTRPHGARPLGCNADCYANRVSIHAPAWGATEKLIETYPDMDTFQSTRPHGARPKDKLCLCSYYNVSIHAPAWGATRILWLSSYVVYPTFQSTRPHGARPYKLRHCQASGLSFNPRARMGRDAFSNFAVSTYASFNPRARMGRDQTTKMPFSIDAVFQSTRPHGARPSELRGGK